jgi:hypothetical protein
MADMHFEDAQCDELIEKTAEAMTDDAIKLLFVSVQQNNLDLCTKYAVRRSVHF